MANSAAATGKEPEERKVEVKCDLCSVGNIVEGAPAAFMFCLECNQNMCEPCITEHGKTSPKESHLLILASIHLGTCAKHSFKPIQLYCVKCEVCLCLSCLTDEHNGHNSAKIEEAYTEYRDKFDTNITKLNETIAFGHRCLQDLKAAEDQVINEASMNEQKIRERCDELRKILDSFEEELLSEARIFSEDRIKEINSQQDEAELQKVQLEEIVRSLEKVKDKGSYYDVACRGKELIRRTEELLTSSVETFTQQLKITHKSFLPGHESIGVKFDKKLIGELLTGEKHVVAEKLLVAIGLHNGTSLEQKALHICLDKRDTVQVVNSTPTGIRLYSAVCVISNVLYAVGLGKTSKELWKWSPKTDEWKRCANLSSGRRAHCVTSVGDKIYALGGEDDGKVTDSILCYDISSDKWTKAGQLCYAVEFPTCVPYEHCVYVFGGRDKNNEFGKSVQVYDTTKGKSSLGINLPPCEHYMMRSVLWRSKAFVIGCDNCFIYDFELKTYDERKRFRTGVVQFGLALDNNTLYISGGGTYSGDVCTCRSDVKSLLVDDFISDKKDAEWKHHATLPTPALIMANSNKPLCVTRPS